MRVAQVLRPAAGGMLQHVHVLAGSLAGRGWQVVVGSPEPLCAPGALDVRVPITARPSITSDLRAIRRIGEMCGGSTVVHAHGVRAGWLCALASRRLPPIVVTAHNMPSGPMARCALRLALRRAGAAVAVSNAVRDVIIRCGCPPDRAFAIPNGIDLARFDAPPDRAEDRLALSLPVEAPVIVYVGRLAREKGVDVLLRAVRSLLASVPDARLVVVGDGPARQDLLSLAVRLDLGAVVAFAGRVDDVRPWLRAADVVAAPSRSEGQGIAVVEAMAAGRPVVASDTGGLRETVVEGVTGLLTPPGDVPCLAAALARVLGDAPAARAMGEAGKARARERYSLAAMVDSIEGLYRAVAPARAGRLAV